MFVPRQIQKKTTAPSKRPTPTSTSNASPKPPPPPPPPPPAIPPKKVRTAELCANDSIDPEVARETVMALEILLSDYSIEHVYGDWLRERMRELEGKDDFIHLSAFVDCRFLARMRPIPSQVSFMKSLVAYESNVLELSADKYHVRRRTKPSMSGKRNFDDCTIYIEPNISKITWNPGRLAKILHETQLPRKYLPLQFVESQDRSWGFVILSSSISQTDAEDKELWPKDWIVLTKAEWRKRDTEYKELRRAAQRVPAFHHPSFRQEGTWQENHVRSRPEKIDPGGRAAAGLKTTVSLDETISRDGETSVPGFELGLIVRLTNLNPSTTKAIINSFVCRSVDRYLRKKAEKKRKKKGCGDDDVAGQDIKSVKINYVDYEKGLSQAYIRQSSQEDSQLIVDALQKRKRNMVDGEDTKGKRADETNEQDWVKGKILTGEEERIYWEKLLAVKNTKGKGKGKRGRKDEQLATSNFPQGLKRSRKDSESSSSHVGKRIKFDE